MSGRKVLVVGLDAATFEVIEPLVCAGKLPTLARLMQEGASGPLRSTIPALTPPAWTSAVTGKNPGKHNIYNFYKLTDGGRSRAPLTPGDLRSRRIWDILHAYGKKAGILHLPLTYPPDRSASFMVAGIMAPRDAQGYAYPAELERELAANIPGYRLEVNAEPLRAGDLNRFLQDALEIQRIQTEETLYLMKTRPWDLLWVLFHTLDKVQHFFWHYMDREHPFYPGSTALEGAIEDFYRVLDRDLARLIEGAGPGTAVMVLSDHGATGMHKYFLVMNWLEREGFLKLKDGKQPWLTRALGRTGLEGKEIVAALRRWRLAWATHLVPRRVRRSVPVEMASYGRIAAHIDWAATTVYCPSAPGSGLRVNLRGREATGTVEPGQEYERVCEEVKRRLLAFSDGATGCRVVRAVHRREEIYSGPCVDGAPDLLVETHPRYCLIEGMGREVLLPAGKREGERSGNHADHGILILRAPECRRGALLEGASILDVTPTLLYLLGVPVQRDMDGRVLAEALRPEVFRERPVSYDQLAPEERARETELSEREKKAIEGMLESLGYM